jgi:hypothetical protein
MFFNTCRLPKLIAGGHGFSIPQCIQEDPNYTMVTCLIEYQGRDINILKTIMTGLYQYSLHKQIIHLLKLRIPIDDFGLRYSYLFD